MTTNKHIKYYEDSFVDSNNLKKFLGTSEGGNRATLADLVESPLLMHKQRRSEFPVWIERNVVTSTSSGTVGFGNTVQYTLPSTGIIKMIYHEAVLAQTGTASYSDYIGGTMITGFDVLHGGNLIYQVTDLQQYYYECFKRLPYEVVTRLLALMGGTSITSTGGAITVGTWIPMLWDYFLAPEQGGFNMALLDSQIHFDIRIYYRAAANVINTGATGAAITSARLILHCINSTDSKDILNAYMTKTGGSIAIPGIIPKCIDSKTAVVTNTKTNINIKNFATYISEIQVIARLSSDLAAGTSKFLSVLQPFSYCDMSLENNTETIIDSQQEYQMLNLEYTSNFGYPAQFTNYPMYIQMSQYDNHASAKDVTGGILGSIPTTWALNVTHQGGANCQLDVLGMSHCLLVIVFNNGKGTMQILE